MAEIVKRNCDKSRRAKPLAILIAVAVLAIVLVALGGISGFFVTVTGVDTVIESHDVPMICTLSGNDLIVDLLESDKSKDVIRLRIILGTNNLPYEVSSKTVGYGDFPKRVVYNDIFINFSGKKVISVEAKFRDGSEKIIWVEKIQIN